MPRIFISYRRDDSRSISGRIYDRLVEAFGEENIFKDVDRIPPGSSFADVLEAELAKCNVLLIIIGQKWVNIVDKDGRRRLEDPHDFVRIEVEKGLNRTGMLVIPVLVDEAPVPSPIDLPDTLDKLSSLQVVQVRHDPDFHRDMGRLIDFLKVLQEREDAVQSREQILARRNLRRTLLGVGILTALVIAGLLMLVAAGVIQIFPTPQPTLDDRAIAMQLVTLTAEAQLALLATLTPNGTATIEAIMTQFVVETSSAGTATADAYTDTPTPTATENFTMTALAQATLNAQATARVATNTPLPTATSTPTSTLNVKATQDAQSTALANARATQNAQITQTAQAVPIRYGTILFQEDFEGQKLPDASSGVTASIVEEDGNHVLRLANTSKTSFGGTGLNTEFYTDHAVTARFKIIKGTASGPEWYLHMRSSSAGDYAGWFQIGCCAGISKNVAGNYQVLANDNYSLRESVWYTIIVQTIDNNIRVYINGYLISHAKDDTLKGGYPHFNLAPGAEIYIDDVKVINLTGSP